MPSHTADRKTARLAAAALVLASVLAIAGFTALGSVFAYPQILHEPTSDILALFRQHAGRLRVHGLGKSRLALRTVHRRKRRCVDDHRRTGSPHDGPE